MIKQTFFAGLMVLAFGLNAQDSSDSLERKNFAVVSSRVSNQHQVVLIAPEATRLNLELRDQRGNRLFSEVYTAKGYFSKSFDLTQLEAGDYTFRATYDGKTTEKVVSKVSTNDLLSQRLTVDQVAGIRKFRFELQGPAEEAYEFAIYDASNQVIYKETIASGERYAKLFNLEKTDSPEFTFVVASDNAFSSRRIVLK